MDSSLRRRLAAAICALCASAAAQASDGTPDTGNRFAAACRECSAEAALGLCEP